MQPSSLSHSYLDDTRFRNIRANACLRTIINRDMDNIPSINLQIQIDFPWKGGVHKMRLWAVKPKNNIFWFSYLLSHGCVVLTAAGNKIANCKWIDQYSGSFCDGSKYEMKLNMKDIFRRKRHPKGQDVMSMDTTTCLLLDMLTLLLQQVIRAMDWSSLCTFGLAAPHCSWHKL